MYFIYRKYTLTACLCEYIYLLTIPYLEYIITYIDVVTYDTIMLQMLTEPKNSGRNWLFVVMLEVTVGLDHL